MKLRDFLYFFIALLTFLGLIFLNWRNTASMLINADDSFLCFRDNIIVLKKAFIFWKGWVVKWLYYSIYKDIMDLHSNYMLSRIEKNWQEFDFSGYKVFISDDHNLEKVSKLWEAFVIDFCYIMDVYCTTNIGEDFTLHDHIFPILNARSVISWVIYLEGDHLFCKDVQGYLMFLKVKKHFVKIPYQIDSIDCPNWGMLAYFISKNKETYYIMKNIRDIADSLRSKGCDIYVCFPNSEN